MTSTRAAFFEYQADTDSRQITTTMLNPTILRQTARVVRPSSLTAATANRAATSFLAQRSPLHSTSTLRKPDDEHGPHKGESGKHVGSYSRTDNTIHMEYPDEANLPPSTPIQGRGGFHFKRTLASFTLEGRVGLVTGGARGLGLVMSQALVVSGADVAIVDLNSEYLRCFLGSCFCHLPLPFAK